MSATFTTTTTFTRTHAKHLAAKVIADLYQCSVFYGRPADDAIDGYEAELIELLANEYVDTYEFGFKEEGKRLLTWHYAVCADGGLHGDADAGAMYAKGRVTEATYFNHLSYSDKWWKLTDKQRTNFKRDLLQRTSGYAPADGNGYWQVDHRYSAGGVRVARKTFRPR